MGRFVMICAGVMLGAATVLASPAAALTPKVPKTLPVTIVSPTTKIPLTSSVVIKWKTDRALRRRQAYQVTFSVGATGRLGGDPAPPGCAMAVTRLVGRGSARGRTIRVTFDPRWIKNASGWCDSVGGWIRITPLTVDGAGRPDLKAPQTLEDILITPVGGAVVRGIVTVDGTPVPPPDPASVVRAY